MVLKTINCKRVWSMLKLIKGLLPKQLKKAIRDFVGEVADRRVKETETGISQIVSILQLEHGMIPPPPKHLQLRVGCYDNFMIHGESLCRQIDDHLYALVTKRMTDFDVILDFGCGCGRVIRPVRRLVGPRARLCGIDIDPEAIAWLREQYGTIADFEVGPPMPPMPYENDTFDFIYGISVFTHLPEDMQFAWLAELRRVSKPGAYLVLTTHGERWLEVKGFADNREVRGRGFHYRTVGGTPGLPEFYQDTYHSQDYIRREWGKHFDVAGIVSRGLDDWQDIAVLRKG